MKDFVDKIIEFFLLFLKHFKLKSNKMRSGLISNYATHALVPTPDVAGKVIIYRLSTDGLVYVKDSTGASTVISGSNTDVVIKEFIKEISTAEVLAMKYSDSPIEVIPAPGAGYAIELISVSCKVIFNTTAYTSATGVGDNLVFSSLPNPTGIAISQIGITDALKATVTREIGGSRPTSYSAAADSIVENAAIVVSTAGEYATTGDSDIIVYGTYRIKSIN